MVNATENFAGEDNLSPVVTPTLSKDGDEQNKQAHKGVAVVDRANRKFFVTLLRCSVKKP